MHLIYDDYNWVIRGGQIIGTVSPTWAHEAFRNGYKLIVVYAI